MVAKNWFKSSMTKTTNFESEKKIIQLWCPQKRSRLYCYTAKLERMKWCKFVITCDAAFTRFFGLFITKTIVNHRTWIWEKPLKNHRCQWSICKKTFNGDGQGVAKPLKNHRWQWCPEEKTLPSHRLKKMTIVEVYWGTLFPDRLEQMPFELQFSLHKCPKPSWQAFWPPHNQANCPFELRQFFSK